MQITQIYLTDHGLEPDGLLKSFGRSVQIAFPNTPYVLYKNQEADAFLKEYFDHRIISAYKKLVPFAYKADLLRQCILFIKGGWYIDIGMYCPLPAPKLDKRIDLVAFREEPRVVPSSTWSVANGVIFAKPNHPVIMLTIDTIVKHCEDNFYGSTRCALQGQTSGENHSARKESTPQHFMATSSIYTPLHETRNRAIILPNGRIFAFYKPNNSSDLRQDLNVLGGKGNQQFR
jgi:mannosyltransferase OCH1-like enzyme